ncbi:signal recognition particle, SRP19 subunit [Echria macrotheca]|uniref:Signal recognition particle, SRP19 subunit n=1 Tax=Echria macrotheca TaxID=438768 RepID=A0AAJ0BRD9_9PEZI|nr:signal recognition particle, SRP19 subunit [Echria macrotheca]
MPTHPRVEEVEDSDVDMSDPSEGDIDDFADSDILRQVNPPTTKKPTPASSSTQPRQPPPPPQSQPQQPRGYPEMITTTDDTAYKAYQCLYPVYFDATRSRSEGRRVSSSLAVRNPLATEIVAACARLGIPSVFEAGKLHPKDWANPGRVKVNLRAPHTQSKVKNKHHLYRLVGEYLVKNPVTEESEALRVVVRGAPPPAGQFEKSWPRPAVPRGWKVGELLPYYSPAMTGGGVSENFLRDMMKEMQSQGGGNGGGPGGMGDMASMLAAAGGMGMGGGMGAGGSGGGEGSGGRKKDKKGKGKS